MRLDKHVEATQPYFDQIVIACLKRKQANKCACGSSLSIGYQIAHKRYGLDITLNDLDLKCGKCHSKEHNTQTVKGTLRYC